MDVTTIVDDEGSLLTVRHVRAAGDQREIGRALAAAAHGAHGDAARPRAVDPRVEAVRRRWFAIHHPALAARTIGVADHFGIDGDDTSVALDVLGTLSRPPGCSVAFYPGRGTADGHALLGRNMDFPTTTFSEFRGRPPFPGERAAVADPWVVELHPDRGYASLTVGFGDVMGAMDGINEAGLAVMLLADDVAAGLEPNSTPQVGLAESQVVRYVLDTSATADEAKDALRLAKHYYQTIPCHYLVADRSGESFVWEHSRHRNREVVVTPHEDGGGRLVCTNHLLHRWPDATGLSDDDTAEGTAVRTYGRWRHLSGSMAEHPVVRRDDVRDHLGAVRFTAPAAGTRTIWHAVYDLDDRTAEISFYRGDEAGTSTYSDPITLPLLLAPVRS